MGHRRIRRDQRQEDMARSRRENGVVKTKERERRRARLIEKLKAGGPPYSQAVTSWLSAEINKPGRLITQQDVDRYLAEHQ